MIATLTKISSDGERAVYDLEIPGSFNRLLEVGPQDLAGIRGDIDDAALKKAAELIEFLELAEYAMVKFRR